MGLGVSWYRCPDSPLGFYLVPAQLPLPLLPLWGSAPLAGASACLSPVCWSTPGVGLVGSLLRHLVFSHVPCFSSGPAACAAFPAAGYLGVFPVTGCLSFSFPGGVGWASALPFFFWASPTPLPCWGRWGFCTLCQGAPVAVVSAWFAGEVTLLPFPYLRVSVLLACGVSGVCGLGWRSRLPFVVRHSLGFVDRVLWLLVGLGTCCFLEPSLGSSLSLPGWLLA